MSNFETPSASQTQKAKFAPKALFIAMLIGAMGAAAFAASTGTNLVGNAIAAGKKASDAGSGSDPDRFQMRKEGDRFVRLDRKTGQMSVCKLTEDDLVCRMAADERMAFEAEVDQLLERIDRLEQRSDRRGRNYGFRYHNDFLSDDEFETTLDRSEKLIRRFYGVMKELGE